MVSTTPKIHLWWENYKIFLENLVKLENPEKLLNLEDLENLGNLENMKNQENWKIWKNLLIWKIYSMAPYHEEGGRLANSSLT